MKKSILALPAIALMANCHSVSDAPSSSPPPMVASSTSAVQINGISNFRQTALVLTDDCRNTKYETNRQTAARIAIDNALGSYAAALRGGLSVEIQSLSLRMRCHNAGPGSLQSYCAADARLSLTASGKESSGQEIALSVSKDVTERAQQGLLCISTMPAVTAAVDKVLQEALVDLQSGLTARTGIPAR